MPGEDYYSLLGVSKNASEDELKRAFRKKAHALHPDKGGDTEKFKKINEAYQVLSDKEKRKQYDVFGSAGVGNGAGNGGGFSGGFPGGFQPGGYGDFQPGDFNFSFGGFGEIFSDFFGAALANVQAEVQISLPQAVLGDSIDLRVGSENLKLTIPSGTRDGDSVVFRGKGKPYRNGRGDLTIMMRVVIPRKLSRRERELYEELKKLS